MNTLAPDRPSILHDAPHVLEELVHGHPLPAKHFKLNIDPEGIAWVVFDSPKSPVNVWNEETLREFNHHLEALEHTASLKALDGNADGTLTRDELRPLPPTE